MQEPQTYDGRGNDFVAVAIIAISPPSEGAGHLHLSVDGGADSDSLSLLVRSPALLPEDSLIEVDGDGGVDFAVVSALVLVRNCEQVIVT